MSGDHLIEMQTMRSGEHVPGRASVPGSRHPLCWDVQHWLGVVDMPRSEPERRTIYQARQTFGVPIGFTATVSVTHSCESSRDNPRSLNVVEAGQGWSRPVKAGQGRSSLVKAGQGWSRLVKAGQGWSRLVKAGQGWSRLVKAGQGWSASDVVMGIIVIGPLDPLNQTQGRAKVCLQQSWHCPPNTLNHMPPYASTPITIPSVGSIV